jgi:hypothetical protein
MNEPEGKKTTIRHYLAPSTINDNLKCGVQLKIYLCFAVELLKCFFNPKAKHVKQPLIQTQGQCFKHFTAVSYDLS